MKSFLKDYQIYLSLSNFCVAWILRLFTRASSCLQTQPKGCDYSLRLPGGQARPYATS